jgi:uncharacterized membrane protein YhaH (DUF805 family)
MSKAKNTSTKKTQTSSKATATQNKPSTTKARASASKIQDSNAQKKPQKVSAKVNKTVKATAKMPEHKSTAKNTSKIVDSHAVEQKACNVHGSACEMSCMSGSYCKVLNYLGFLKLSPRLNRCQFLMLHIIWGVIYSLLLMSLIDFNFNTDVVDQINSVVYGNDYTLYQTLVLCIALPILFINNIFMLIRRLNDIDLRGWWALVCLLPFVGLCWYIALYFIPGTKGANRFGESSCKA